MPENCTQTSQKTRVSGGPGAQPKASVPVTRHCGPVRQPSVAQGLLNDLASMIVEIETLLKFAAPIFRVSLVLGTAAWIAARIV